MSFFGERAAPPQSENGATRDAQGAAAPAPAPWRRARRGWPAASEGVFGGAPRPPRLERPVPQPRRSAEKSREQLFPPDATGEADVISAVHAGDDGGGGAPLAQSPRRPTRHRPRPCQRSAPGRKVVHASHAARAPGRPRARAANDVHSTPGRSAFVGRAEGDAVGRRAWPRPAPRARPRLRRPRRTTEWGEGECPLLGLPRGGAPGPGTRGANGRCACRGQSQTIGAESPTRTRPLAP